MVLKLRRTSAGEDDCEHPNHDGVNKINGQKWMDVYKFVTVFILVPSRGAVATVGQSVGQKCL